ncbi:MAG: hypothetical protein ACK4ND_19780 [Cytophagaceae bacterium]
MDDYCTIRPHASIHGLTPLEAYSGSIPDLDFISQMREAKKVRIAMNRIGCGGC